MKVSTVMIPIKKLTCINVDNTLREALSLIEDKILLSLPVVDGSKYIGVLSKQHMFETFFKQEQESKEVFLDRKVKELMFAKVQSIAGSIRIEEAAVLFIDSKVRFLAIVDDKGELEGIVTQQAIFKQYQLSFGQQHNSLVIYTNDYRGMIANITHIIAKNGGDIRNMIMFHTEVMNLMEIFMRIDAEDFDKVIEALEKNNIDVRDVKRIL